MFHECLGFSPLVFNNFMDPITDKGAKQIGFQKLGGIELQIFVASVFESLVSVHIKILDVNLA